MKKDAKPEPKDSLVRVQYADLVCNIKETAQALGDVRITIRDANQFGHYSFSAAPKIEYFRLSREQALDLASALKLAVDQAR